MTGFTQIGRLAIREVRDEVRFYYAMPDTMKGALLLGTIRASLLRKQDTARFMALVTVYRDVVADIIEDQTGHRPTFKNPVTAPDHERGAEPWKGDA